MHAQKQPGLFYIGVVTPVGRLTVAQLDGLAAIARRFGSGTLRLTVWQNLLISDVPEDRLPDGRAPTVITYETRTGAVSVRAGAPAGELDRVLATLRQGPPSPGVRGRGAEGDGQAIDRGT